MANNYMTAEYMASILEQYRQNSPLKTSDRNGQHLADNGEQVRRQVNESLFRTIDDSFERQMRQMAAIKRPDVSSTPNIVQQMMRTPVITSDSFRAPKSMPIFNQYPKSMGGAPDVRSIRSHYYGSEVPQTRIRSQFNTYKAKVIDYSNGIIERPRIIDYTHKSLARADPSMPSVLTERNTDPMQLQSRTNQSVNALHSAISAISQKPFVPKPILKNSPPKSSPQILSPPKHTFSLLVPNTSTPMNQRSIIAGKSANISPQSQANKEMNSLITDLEDKGIIRTKDDDNIPCFYCHYCNVYIKKIPKLPKHCGTEFHKKNMFKTFNNSLENPLNKNFILGPIQSNNRMESIGLKAETIFRMELNRISPERKHNYLKRGIRLKNPGGNDVYWCKYCELSISSLVNIESHISSESHRQNEKRPTLSKFVSQSSEPIIGLEYITEYKSIELKDPIYGCSLCQAIEDPYDMFIHICSFRHKLNLLKKLNPNEAILNSIRESPQAIKEINRRINELSITVANVANYKTVIPTKAKMKELQNVKTCQPEIEVIDITDDDVERMFHLKNYLSVRVNNEEQAVDAAIVIQYLKESVVKYYLNKIPAHLRRVLISKVLDKEVMETVNQ